MKQNNPLHSSDELQYLITPPHACSYLPNRQARMVFLDPAQRIDVVTLSELSRTGFRRSGSFVYRPECHSCRQCLSSRIVVADFKPTHQHKKALRHNTDLELKIIPASQAQDVHYQLYQKYICVRHADGDMYPPTYDQFEKFLVHSCGGSFFMEFWQQNQLYCVAVCDQLDDGLSAVYTFFDPDLQRRSFGTFAILQQVDYVKSLGLDYLYLGYWVPHAKKMKYKIQFTPMDVLIDGQWHRINTPLDDSESQRLGDSLQTISSKSLIQRG